MDDLPSQPGNADEPESSPGVQPETGTPRWVKVFAAAVGVLVILFVILKIAGIEQHGPGRHMRGGHGGASRVAAGAKEIAVTADDLAFDPAEIAVTAGEDVAVVLTSIDSLHDFTIDELDAHVAAERGETAKGGFRADRPGRYAFYCSEPGHRKAGMEGALVVTQASVTRGGGHRPPTGGHGGP